MHCRAAVNNHALAHAFWLGYDHFDPPTTRSRHTLEDAERVYRSAKETAGFRKPSPQFAFASYSRGDPPSPPQQVWIAISYNVRDIPSTMGGPPAATDEVVVIDDHTLRIPWIIGSLPTRC